MTLFRKVLLLTVCLTFIGISPHLFGQNEPPPAPNVEPTPGFGTVVDEIKKLIAGYGSSKPSLDALAAPPSDTLVVPEGISQSLYSNTPANPLAVTQTQQSLANYFALVPNAKSSDDIISNIVNNTLTFGESNAPIPTAAGLYAGCSTSIITGGASGLSDCLLQKQTPPFTNVDLNSLVGPLVYKTGQDKTAANFISAAAGLSYPLAPTDLNRLATRQNTDVKTLLATNPDIVKYLAAMRSYATMQSVALSNFYQLYAERMPSHVDEANNKDLFDALNAIKMPNASQLQVENYMATRRITDPKWVESLSKDTPAALLRQLVILMAENLAESYNNRLATERLIATMSVMDLGQAGLIRAQILEKSTAEVGKQTAAGNK